MAISILGEIVVFCNSHKLDLYGLKEDEDEDKEEDKDDESRRKEKPKENGLEEEEESIPLKAELSGSLLAV